MVKLLSDHSTSIIHITRTLEATSKVAGLNIRLKHNQVLIIKYVMTYRENILDKHFRSESFGFDQGKVGQLQGDLGLSLCDKQVSTETSLFQQELVSLLATCAEGEDRYIESMCQTILKLDQVLSILLETKQTSIEKRGFLKFETFFVECRTSYKCQVLSVGVSSYEG
jgi:inositol 1,4,5-triphosphate receptor type 1